MTLPYPVQCAHCNKRYDVDVDEWKEFVERIEVALHTLCPVCFRNYVLSLVKS
jgi:hypothetical protein